MTFNNKNGKTEYIVIGKKKETQSLTNKVKKGTVQRTKEHKMLGTWVNETGDYGINIKKKKEHDLEIYSGL